MKILSFAWRILISKAFESFLATLGQQPGKRYPISNNTVFLLGYCKTLEKASGLF